VVAHQHDGGLRVGEIEQPPDRLRPRLVDRAEGERDGEERGGDQEVAAGRMAARGEPAADAEESIETTDETLGIGL
jgi:hypothetical protein